MAVAPGQAQFAAGVLKGIGAPVTPANIAGFVGWSQAEGGTNWQRNNPLNTTEGAGATSTFNSAGVKGYPNAQVGVAATVKTLLNGDYGGIVGAFKANNPNALAPAIGKSPWGTSGSLAAQTIADTLKGGGISVPSGTTLPALPGAAASTSAKVPSFDQAGYNQANARYVAGSFLAKSGSSPFGGTDSLLAPGLLTTAAPNPADYQTAQTALQKAAGSTPLEQHPAAFNAAAKGSGYVNPLPGVTQWERTDQGVDAKLPVGAAIRAIGTAKVIGIEPNWYSGQPLVYYQLLDGPDAGKYVYVAEQINSIAKPGTIVQKGGVIARYAPSGTGIETGWATASGQTQAMATTGYKEGYATGSGKNFRNFLNGLGAGAGSGAGLSIGAGADPDDAAAALAQQQAAAQHQQR